MSSGEACSCDERKKPLKDRQWEVMTYRGNHSAFNGYKFTSSDYSAVVCNACNYSWRTKADYVDRLKHRSRKRCQ